MAERGGSEKKMSIGKNIDEFSIALVLNASGIGKEINKAVRDVQNGTKQVEAEAQRLGNKINTLAQTTKLWVRGFYAFTASMSVAFYQYTKEAEAFGQTAKEIQRSNLSGSKRTAGRKGLSCHYRAGDY